MLAVLATDALAQAARVVLAVGDVTLVRGGDRSRLAAGATVNAGDTVVTGAAEQRAAALLGQRAGGAQARLRIPHRGLRVHRQHRRLRARRLPAGPRRVSHGHRAGRPGQSGHVPGVDDAGDDRHPRHALPAADLRARPVPRQSDQRSCGAGPVRGRVRRRGRRHRRRHHRGISASANISSCPTTRCRAACWRLRRSSPIGCRVARSRSARRLPICVFPTFHRSQIDPSLPLPPFVYMGTEDLTKGSVIAPQNITAVVGSDRYTIELASTAMAARASAAIPARRG